MNKGDKPKSRWNLLINIGLLVLSVLISLALIEIGCRIYLRVSNGRELLTRWEFRATCPKPYQGSDYFNQKFLDESRRVVSLTRPAGANFVMPKNFEGKYINVRNNLRQTTDQPKSYANRVLVFGASTVFSQEVPDRETIPSHLQRLINHSEKRTDLIVYNYGVVSMTAAQQTERLKQLSINPGDIVIFYDGGTEIYYPVYNGYKNGWLPGKPSYRPVVKLTWYQKMQHSIYLKYNHISAAIKISMNIYDRTIPETITDSRLLENNISLAATSYFNTITSASRYVSQKGGCFFHFLQPTIFQLKKYSDYEKELLKNYLQTPPGIVKAFQLGYPQLISATDNLNKAGIKSYNISDILDERSGGEEFYFDFAHVNHLANRQIANKIYEMIFNNPENTLGCRKN